MASDLYKPRGLNWRASSGFVIATVAVGLFTDLFLYGLVVPILPFLLHDRIGLGPEYVQHYVSVLLAVHSGACMVCSLPVGLLVDRAKTRKWPFLAGLVAQLAATVLFAFAQTMPLLITARLLQGVSAAVVRTVGLAMVVDKIRQEDLGKVMGFIFSFVFLGTLIAPVIGGILYDKTGYGGVFGVSAAALVVDFIMRIFMMEKESAERYDPGCQTGVADIDPERLESTTHFEEDSEGFPHPQPNEHDQLLPSKIGEEHKISASESKILQKLPILYVLTDPSLLMALLISLVHGILIAAFDATIPTEGQYLYNFSSLQAGLIFLALDVPNLIFGPIGGWATDKYGTKAPAVIGFGALVPCLVLLRLPEEIAISRTGNIAIYCLVLSLNGISMTFISAPNIVEASQVVQRYHKANLSLFGEKGPYGQLFAFNILAFTSGLSIGAVLAGALRDSVGYGNMNLVFAMMCMVSGVLSFAFLGGRPKFPPSASNHPDRRHSEE